MSQLTTAHVRVTNSVYRQLKAWASTQPEPGKAEADARAEICRRLDITRGTLHAKLSNRRRFSPEQLVVVGEVLSCDWRKLMDVCVNRESVPL